MIWFGFIVLIIAVVVGMNFLAKKGSDNAPLTPNEDGTIISTYIDPAEEWIKGNPSSAVTLFEYSDFQCPACAAQYPLVKQVAEEFGEQIRIVYRHYPLTSIHRNAEEAAYAAEAAGKQGMFWEYHDILFEEQGSWSNIGDPDDTFIDYAETLTLDIEKFKDDYQSRETRNAVDEDLESGRSANVRGTPTFFLNGKIMETPANIESWRKVIETEINLVKFRAEREQQSEVNTDATDDAQDSDEDISEETQDAVEPESSPVEDEEDLL